MPNDYRQGYWRNDGGALITNIEGLAPAPLRWQDGFLVDSTNALVVTGEVTGSRWMGGYKRSPGGALLMVNSPVPPVRWQDGMLVDSQDALVATLFPGTDQRWSQGYLRTPDGAIVRI